MNGIRSLLFTVLSLFQMALLARIVISYVQMFARDWRPRGIVLVVAEAVYTVTDPPLRFLRRFLPPIRIGQVALDTSFLVLFLLVSVLMNSL